MLRSISKLVELDGPDQIYWLGDNALQIVDPVANFIAQLGTRCGAPPDRNARWRPFYSPIFSIGRPPQTATYHIRARQVIPILAVTDDIVGSPFARLPCAQGAVPSLISAYRVTCEEDS